jgi:phosphoribosylformylglycinamidine cyclo-ligase
LAFKHQRHNTIGIDLVAMSVNDVVVQGAEPLFFLDYFATGRLVPETAHKVVTGIAEGCRQAGAALIGGETAEMPGMYAKGEYDLAGFCVGAVERDRILDGRAVIAGDALIGLSSSGPHSNGYSLIRKIIDDGNIDISRHLGADRLIDLLLAPTRIYVKPLLALLRRVNVHALAHITGGGLPGNLRRVLPHGYRAIIDAGCWLWPPIFNWLQQTAQIETDEMYRTFNCGLGMIAVIGEANVDTAMELLRDQGEAPSLIGRVEATAGEPEVIVRQSNAQP